MKEGLAQLVTSTSNARVKFARSLARKKERIARRQFIVEGTRLIEEANRAGAVPALIFFQPVPIAGDPRTNLLLEKFSSRKVEILSVTPAVMQSLSQTDTSQGIVAVYPLPDLPFPASPQFLLILDTLRDPGNLGTILRTAWAAGVDGVILSPGTADAYNPKVVRAGMGAHFSLPIATRTWEEIETSLAAVPRVYLSDAAAEKNYYEVDWTVPCALIIGGEAEGASEHARQIATTTVSIAMPGRAESLNAAVATGILLFHAVRHGAKSPRMSPGATEFVA